MEPVTHSGLLGTLGINGKLFIAQLVNFGVILFVLWRWAFTPILKAMDAREKKIADGLSNAEEAERRLENATREQEALLKEARVESRKLIEQARLDAEEGGRRVKESAQAELERQLTEARERLKREKEAVLKTARQEVAELVVAAVEKVAGESDKERERKQVEQAIAELT